MGKKRSSIEGEVCDSKVRLKHYCHPRKIVELNKCLSEVQRSKIRLTPFSCLLNMREDFELRSPLLMELLKRWDDRRFGFRIQEKLVPFTPLDVCMSIGLRMIGRSLPKDEGDNPCLTKELFDADMITLAKIWELLNMDFMKHDDEVENFTRLYIMLGFAEFYFPTPCRGRAVYGLYIPLLDNLEELDSYQWGVFVYEFLLRAMNNACKKINSGQNEHEVSLCGCAAILQIWAMEHISSWPLQGVVPKVLFPRMLCIPRLHLKGKQISKVLRTSRIIIDLALSEDEMAVDIVKDTVDAFMKGGKGEGLNRELTERVGILEEKNATMENEIIELKLQIKSMMATLKCKVTGGKEVVVDKIIDSTNVPRRPSLENVEEQQLPQVVIEETAGHPSKEKEDSGSNMQKRRKKNPRKCTLRSQQ